jgi:aminoglycoside phosphotransferase family enzyme/predicted kinase
VDPKELAHALRDPAAFPVPGARSVEIAQTHASIVFLVGDTAWKAKKPVHLGFLDFSTLGRRHADCERELELNRRMVPDVYRGLASVVRRDGELRVVREASPRDAVVEWLVEMRRLPAAGMLDRLIPAGGVTDGHLRHFAHRLAAFHAHADAGPDVARHGAIDVVRARQRDCLFRLAEHAARPAPGLDAPLDAGFVRALDRAARAWLDRIAPTLERRRLQGRVRDGHGDLQAANACMVDGRIEAYDCLEFRDEYRCADQAMDPSFLAMDLDRFGRPDLAESFLAAYAEASGERGIDDLFRFFRMHYAIVRAMTESIRLHQAETPASDLPTIAGKVRTYALLAAGYAVEPATVLVMGLPATGKSTLAAHLGHPMRAPVRSSDRVRKAMHGVAPTERAKAEAYGTGATDATYRELARLVADASGTVIVDASQRTRAQRTPLVAAAAARGVPWILVDVDADRRTIESRMARRAADPARISDADLSVHDRLRAEREPPDEIPPAHRMQLTSEDRPGWLDAAAAAVLARLLDAGHGPVTR